MRRFSLAILMGGLGALSAGCAGGDGREEVRESDEPLTQQGVVEAGDSIRLFYRVVGTGTDTLVVVHGGPGMSMDYFFADLAPLADQMTLIFYDQRGAGQSSLVSDSMQLAASWFAEDLEAIRSHFEVESLNILGHSWGAGVAALYAMRYPTRVGRLIIVGGIPLRAELLRIGFDEMRNSRDTTELRRMRELVAALVAEPEDADAEICRAFYTLWFRPFYGNSAAADRSRGDFCAGSAEARRNARERVERFTMASLGDWDWRDSLRDLNSPALIIHGVSDPIPLAGALEWATTLPNARLLALDGIGHFPYVEAPDQFFEAVRSFVAGDWAGGAER